MNNNPWRMGDLLSNPRWVGEVQQIIKMGHVLVKACKHKYLNGAAIQLINSQEVTMETSGMEATMEDRCMTVVMDMYRTPMTQACTLQQLQLMEPTLFMAISNK